MKQSTSKKHFSIKEVNSILRERILVWGMMFMPDHFRDLTPDFHKELIEAVTIHNELAVVAPRGHGKAQPLSARILTPNGWTTMGQIVEGDEVIGYDGLPTKVIGCYPQGIKEIFKVQTSDGRETECCEDHLWTVQTPSNTKDRFITKPLKSLIKNYKSDRFDKRNGKHYIEYRHFIPTVKPIQFKAKELPIDPYTLGAWLGDGVSAGGRICSDDPEILSYFPYKTTKNKAKYMYGILGLHKQLRENNLLNNKHIPKDYLFASVEQKTCLLQGLIDTDGNIQADGYVFDFSQKNEKLIDQVVELIRSLGGTCKKGNHKTTCNGKVFHSYRLTCKVPKDIIPCRLIRKAIKWKGSLKTRSPIVSIESNGYEYCKCIKVQSKYELYVTDDYILTHNTTILSFLYPLHQIYHKEKHYIILTGYTKEKASEHISAIAEQIKTNDMLKAIYGPIEVTRDSAQVLELRNQDGFTIRVHALGAEQLGGKRGGKFGAYRPDLIIIDDIDDDKLVQSPDRRREMQRLIDDALIPMGDKNTQYIAVGTMLHFDCQIAKMVDKAQYLTWHKMFYTAVIDEPTKKVLWKECRSFEWLMQLKKNKPLTYAKEFQNNPVAGENTRFAIEMFRYWQHLDAGYILYDDNKQIIAKGLWTDCVPAIACDLAWSEKKTADETVIMSCLLTPKGDIIVYNYHNERGMRPERFRNILFDQVAHLKELTNTLPKVGMEKAMLERINKDLIKAEMRKRNTFFVLKDLKWEHDKLSRIEIALEARYANNTMYHKHGMGELEEQLLQFPYGKHDDIIDALQGTTQLLKYTKSVKKQHIFNDIDDPGFNYWRTKVPGYIRKRPKITKGQFLFGKRKSFSLPSKEAPPMS